MTWYSFDQKQCMLFILSVGQSTNHDYEALYQSYLMLDKEAVSQNKESLSFLLVEGSFSRADASWRRHFAELRLLQKAKRRLSVLVTDSTILRGIITVLNWVQPKPENEELFIVTTFEERVRWVESKRGPSRPSLERLYQEALIQRQQAKSE
jgi:hypothetical protein